MSKYTHHSIYSPGEKLTREQYEAEQTFLAHERHMDRIDRQASRRRFITGLCAAGAATAAAASLTGCINNGTVQTAVGPNPLLDTLNFALNLEYFEASFYNFVANGTGIPAAMQGSGAGTVTGGAKIPFTNPQVANVASQLAQNELAHVADLQQTITTLGYSYVPMPNINLAAAGAITTDALFLMAARRFETVGVSAYTGGAANLISNPTVLTAAAEILHLEAQHESYLRMLCITTGIQSPAVDSLDYPPINSMNAGMPFNTNPSSGLGPVRTTSQVLQIVYATTSPGVSGGGFFPNGLNGNIHTT